MMKVCQDKSMHDWCKVECKRCVCKVSIAFVLWPRYEVQNVCKVHFLNERISYPGIKKAIDSNKES